MLSCRLDSVSAHARIWIRHVVLIIVGGGVLFGVALWTATPAFCAGLSSLSFVNESIGWVADDDGRIFATADGGATWLEVSNPMGAATTIDFVTSTYGWASDGYTLRETRDGGLTWAVLSSPAPAYAGISRIDCFSTTSGSIIHGGAAATTSDGAATWTRKALKSFERNGTSEVGIPADLVQSGVGVLDVAGGGLTYRSAGQLAFDGLVWSTADGLSTYSRGNFESDAVGGWDNVDRVGDRVYLVSKDGYFGSFEATHVLTPPLQTGAADVSDVDFETGGRGWVAANDGIWFTDDDGASWRRIHIGSTTDLSMLSDRVGYAITPTQVLKTNDGQNWQALPFDITGPTGAVYINGGDEFSGSNVVDVSWDLWDASGVQDVRLSAAAAAWTPWVPAAPALYPGWTLMAGSPDAQWDADFGLFVEARDALGNISTLRDFIHLDMRSPTTTSNAAGAYDGTATVSFSASDSGSGIERTQWRLDGSEWVSSTVAATSVLGTHTIEFYSVDRVGNVEPTQSVSLNVWDATTLSLKGPSSPPAYRGTATFTARLLAAGAGVAGKKILFEKATAAGWMSIGSATTDADGLAATSLTGVVQTQRVRARFEEESPLRASTSGVVEVRPRVRLTASTSWSSLYLNRTYYAKGYIEPKHGSIEGKLVVKAFKRRANGTFPVTPDRTFSAGSKYVYYSASRTRYQVPVRLTSRGYWKLVVYHPTDTQNAGTYGSPDYVRVR